MVPDTLSWKSTSMESLSHLLTQKWPLALEVQTLANQMVKFYISTPKGILAFVYARYSLLEQIQAHQFDDSGLRVIQDKVLSRKA